MPKLINSNKLMAAIPAAERHDKWIVVTTVSPPTAAITKLAAISGWKLLVIGDYETPANWSTPGCIFLGVKQQRELDFSVINIISTSSYSRLNIGYLYAIQHGAKYIYTTDDANSYFDGMLSFSFTQTGSGLIYADTSNNVMNPYAHFGQSSIWPRGFPLDKVNQEYNYTYRLTNFKTPAIQQALVNGEPDLDAFCWLAKRKEIPAASGFLFDHHAPPVVLPKGVFAPFNSKNTLYHHDAFWALMLPPFVANSLTNIWRGYLVQRLLWLIDQKLAYLPPSATEPMNLTGSLSDFHDELLWYDQSDKIIEMITNWNCQKSFFECMSLLSSEMLAFDFWSHNDDEFVKSWIADLKYVKYKQPQVSKSRTKRGIQGTPNSNATVAKKSDLNATTAQKSDLNATFAKNLNLNTTKSNRFNSNATKANRFNLNATTAQKSDLNATFAKNLNLNTTKSNRFNLNATKANRFNLNATVAQKSNLIATISQKQNSNAEATQKPNTTAIVKHNHNLNATINLKPISTTSTTNNLTQTVKTPLKLYNPEPDHFIYFTPAHKDDPLNERRLDLLQFCENSFDPDTKENITRIIGNKPVYSFPNLLLIIVFNLPYYTNIKFLDTLYRDKFPNILFCSETHAYQEMILQVNEGFTRWRIRQITFLNITSARGNFGYECAIRAMEMNYQVDGYLVAADDDLLNIWSFTTRNWNQVYFMGKGVGAINRFTTPKKRYTLWQKDTGKDATNAAFDEIESIYNGSHPNATDKRLFEIITTFVKTRWKNKVNMTNVTIGSGDLYYVPKNKASIFMEVSKIFLKHRVFLEIAVPTVMAGLYESKMSDHLLKGWGYWRNDRHKVLSFFVPTNEYLHPLKFSSIENNETARAQYCETYISELLERW